MPWTPRSSSSARSTTSTSCSAPQPKLALDLRQAEVARQPPARPAAAPKLSRPGPGRPAGSKNRHRARHHDVGKTAKRAETIKGHRVQRG
ncbi:hypothetical protein SipoB123_33895 [Streptomyces ipomoeae]|nr:hypothetical protein SipoB123_33895 [Streptomyces ipomoeae]